MRALQCNSVRMTQLQTKGVAALPLFVVVTKQSMISQSGYPKFEILLLVETLRNMRRQFRGTPPSMAHLCHSVDREFTSPASAPLRREAICASKNWLHAAVTSSRCANDVVGSYSGSDHLSRPVSPAPSWSVPVPNKVALNAAALRHPSSKSLLRSVLNRSNCSAIRSDVDAVMSSHARHWTRHKEFPEILLLSSLATMLINMTRKPMI